MKQIFLEQGAKQNRRICKELRKAGYKITVSSLGNQVTNCGMIKTTMLSIFNEDNNIYSIINKQDFESKGL